MNRRQSILAACVAFVAPSALLAAPASKAVSAAGTALTFSRDDHSHFVMTDSGWKPMFVNGKEVCY